MCDKTSKTLDFHILYTNEITIGLRYTKSIQDMEKFDIHMISIIGVSYIIVCNCVRKKVIILWALNSQTLNEK